METRKSKVTGASYSRSYDSKYGQMHVHSLTFENGDIGEYSSKSKEQNKFVIDKEADYTYENDSNTDFPAKIKPVFTENKGRPQNNRSFALSYAKDLAVALIDKDKEYGGTEGIIKVANKFHEWLEEKTE